MSKAISHLSNSLMRGLACAALNPGLRSILIFDAESTVLQFAAQSLVGMLREVTNCQVAPVQLSVVETEEDLWGGLALRKGEGKSAFEWQQGSLTGGRGQELRLVIIPDLTRLSLATARACVALMGSNVGYLERYGHQDIWQPNLCWLAGCSRQGIGAVSPHLLDRFALRLSGENFEMGDRINILQKWLRDPELLPIQHDLEWTTEWIEALQQAKALHPEIGLEAQKRVLDYITLTEVYSVRRGLALLRLAETIAQLTGATQVTKQEVDSAAQMIGLAAIKPSLDEFPIDHENLNESDSVDEIDAQAQKPVGEIQPIPENQASTPVQEPVYRSNTTDTLSSQSLPLDSAIADPYPEDTTPIQREAASLRLPLRRFKNSVSGRGAIVGVELTTTPQDLAIVSTILEAAKYQPIRRSGTIEQQNGSHESRSLIFQPTDLRRYRRAVVPEQMLTLVIDYTCLRECQWQEALLPYLQWAYVERASLCLIQVGSANPIQELQAEKIVAQNVLVPRISNGLEASGGQATPLAHGLDLASQTLRHALQHGRSAVRQAVLVVISDGRGNVPLSASRTNQKPVKPVNRQGIEDALQVAQQIRDLKQVEAIVLNPQPQYYADLPVKLAQAIGAKIAPIPLLKDWEVEQ